MTYLLLQIFYWVCLKKGTDIAGNLGKDFLKKQTDRFNKEYLTGKCSESALTKMEMKNEIKIIDFFRKQSNFIKMSYYKGY